MNEEEKKAVEFIKDLISWSVGIDLYPNKEECEKLETILNLIEKLQEKLKLMDDYNYWIQLAIDRRLELEKLQKENEEKTTILLSGAEKVKKLEKEKEELKDKIEELRAEYEYLDEENKRVNKFEIELLQELIKE